MEVHQSLAQDKGIVVIGQGAEEEEEEPEDGSWRDGEQEEHDPELELVERLMRFTIDRLLEGRRQRARLSGYSPMNQNDYRPSIPDSGVFVISDL
jgi:hypothetical protein